MNGTGDKFWQIEVTGKSLVTTQGNLGIEGKAAERSFSSQNECLNEATKLIDERLRQGYIEGGDNFLKKYELPQDLKEAMKKKRVVYTTHGKFVLGPLQEVRSITVLVDPSQFNEQDCVPLEGDPYEHESGLFCTTAYALVSDSPEVSNPDEILVWLPEVGLYGCWDADANQLYVYPGIKWSDLEKDLSTYLLTRWGYNLFPNILCHIKVWEHFDFLPRDLTAQVKRILSITNTEVRHKLADEFLRQYEDRLLSHPYNWELDHLYHELLILYNYQVQHAEDKTEYVRAISWVERNLNCHG